MQEFFCPVRLYAGSDALSALSRYQAERVLVVTDSYFSQNGLAKQIAQRVPGAEIRIFDKVVADPPASLAAEGAALCRQFRPQLLIALGGGSPMDCAKAIRLAADVPMIFLAIPTTSGSGSEMTSFSILSHEGVKHPVIDPFMRPDAAILDDTLLQSLPSKLVADTGMDLLAHCIEAIGARKRSLVTDALASMAVETVLKHLANSWRGDTDVRGTLHQAASMAGMAFDQAGLGICHAMAHALGGVFHLPHGRLCAMLLPHVMQINASAALTQYAALANRCGCGAATERMAVRNLIQAIQRLRSTLQLPASLEEAGVSRELQKQKEEAVVTAALADPCCETNPVPVTKVMLQTLYEAVRHG